MFWACRGVISWKLFMQSEIAWLLSAPATLPPRPDHVPSKIPPSIRTGTTSHKYAYSSSADVDTKDSSPRKKLASALAKRGH
jgi:hypothetical protein